MERQEKSGWEKESEAMEEGTFVFAIGIICIGRSADRTAHGEESGKKH